MGFIGGKTERGYFEQAGHPSRGVNVIVFRREPAGKVLAILKI